jgi:hypothetical protein
MMVSPARETSAAEELALASRAATALSTLHVPVEEREFIAVQSLAVFDSRQRRRFLTATIDAVQQVCHLSQTVHRLIRQRLGSLGALRAVVSEHDSGKIDRNETMERLAPTLTNLQTTSVELVEAIVAWRVWHSNSSAPVHTRNHLPGFWGEVLDAAAMTSDSAAAFRGLCGGADNDDDVLLLMLVDAHLIHKWLGGFSPPTAFSAAHPLGANADGVAKRAAAKLQRDIGKEPVPDPAEIPFADTRVANRLRRMTKADRVAKILQEAARDQPTAHPRGRTERTPSPKRNARSSSAATHRRSSTDVAVAIDDTAYSVYAKRQSAATDSAERHERLRAAERVVLAEHGRLIAALKSRIALAHFGSALPLLKVVCDSVGPLSIAASVADHTQAALTTTLRQLSHRFPRSAARALGRGVGAKTSIEDAARVNVALASSSDWAAARVPPHVCRAATSTAATTPLEGRLLLVNTWRALHRDFSRWYASGQRCAAASALRRRNQDIHALHRISVWQKFLKRSRKAAAAASAADREAAMPSLDSGFPTLMAQPMVIATQTPSRRKRKVNIM